MIGQSTEVRSTPVLYVPVPYRSTQYSAAEVQALRSVSVLFPNDFPPVRAIEGPQANLYLFKI